MPNHNRYEWNEDLVRALYARANNAMARGSNLSLYNYWYVMFRYVLCYHIILTDNTNFMLSCVDCRSFWC